MSIKENRKDLKLHQRSWWYNLPDGFDWNYYITYYQDLKNISTKRVAARHYLHIGKKEKRIFNATQVINVKKSDIIEESSTLSFKIKNDDIKDLTWTIQSLDNDWCCSLIKRKNNVKFTFNIADMMFLIIAESKIYGIKSEITLRSPKKNQVFLKYSDTFNSVIPLNLFQTWFTLNLPTKMKENVDILKKENPEFNYFLFDDFMCRNFIKEYYDKEVLECFDKLKPGAYKADLWRYCILYKFGGIYLDIKYKCINGFKFKYLTDKEYWVKDRPMFDVPGIYQALMVTFPGNSKLYKAINDIIQNCKNNIYTKLTPLSVTGPGLLSNYFNPIDFYEMTLHNVGDIITFNNIKILEYYREYRYEQSSSRPDIKFYYDSMWWTLDIYKFKILKSLNTVKFCLKKNITIKDTEYNLCSSKPVIILYKEKLYVYLVYLNNIYHEEGYLIDESKTKISLISRFMVDDDFKKISDEISVDYNYYYNFSNPSHLGIDNFQLINYHDNVYYLGNITSIDDNENIITSYSYDIENNIINLKKNIISTDFYTLKDKKKKQKNCNFVNYKDEICVISNWYPLVINSIDYKKNVLCVKKIKYNIDSYFQDVESFSSGFNYKDNIWFILNKVQTNNLPQRPRCFNLANHYQHFFAIFDLDMNLISYSETFKFQNDYVEICNGFIIQQINDEEKIIISYGSSNCNSFISSYCLSSIKTQINWYNFESNTENNDNLINFYHDIIKKK